MKKGAMTLPVILWLLSALWLCLTLCLSSHTGEETAGLSLRIAEYLARLLDIPGGSFAAFHSALRTAAHMVVFFTLTALSCGAAVSTFRQRNKAWLCTALICIIISVFDEYRKAFIPGRHCTWSEAGLNVLGCLLGAAAAWCAFRFIARAGRRRRS